MTTRIALDAMGGDHAPQATVRGAVDAVRRDAELSVLLVGDEAALRAELDAAGPSSDERARLEVQHASQNITCEESPVEGLRSKPDSSIKRACEAVARGRAEGLVAAGSTGAAVAAATLNWKLIPGVRRAGIAVTLPNRKGGYTVLCDAGANISCKPLHLYHYGIMGSVYAKSMCGAVAPKVGLLNVGSEEAKGNELVRETKKLFDGSRLNFAGHIEGNEVFEGEADVVVCEGFVGNVVLKVAEGLFEAFSGALKGAMQEVQSGDPGVVRTLGDFLDRFRRRMDYAEQGGAPLLGVNGLCLIAHGRSDARAIRNALLLGARFTRQRVLQKMYDELKAGGSHEDVA
ncbi:MAG TPA: phosphate acyltransferase PlsX [Planctomycetota bacterium]|nr:phosphate acyltransferase PlsX [Planctomycetota bacterium]